MNNTFQEVMVVFKNHFQPATDSRDSDEQKTTDEIFELFNDLIQDDKVTIKDVYKLMKDSGYVYDMVQDEFKWLLKRKASS